MTEARNHVLAFVRSYPGVHVREVERRLNLSSKLANYHLAALEHDGMLERIQEKGYARFLPRVTKPRWSPRDIAFLCLMRRAVAFRITLLLLARGEMTQGDLARTLDLAKPSTTYHLHLLEDDDVVSAEARGRERWYSLAEPDRVRGLLADFTPLREDLDPFAKVWDDLFG
ncbi:MAG: helix-turn-helix domain-containing protein [Candidatus Thermoplasmatota archaeon]